MTVKLPQIITLLCSLAVTLGLPTAVTGWVTAHQSVYLVLVGIAVVLHALLPSVFGSPTPQAEKTTGIPPAASVLVLALLFGATAAFAQSSSSAVPGFGISVPAQATSTGFSASSDALAVDYRGAWSAGSFTTESFDLLDWGKTRNNRLFITGNQLTAPTPGFNLYTGGVRVSPDISGLLAHTNFPSNALTVFFDGSVGGGEPSDSGSHIAWLAGGGINYSLTSQLTWKTLEVQYGGMGAQRMVGISSGLGFIFGK